MFKKWFLEVLQYLNSRETKTKKLSRTNIPEKFFEVLQYSNTRETMTSGSHV
jgi:hypothetical protein